MLATARCAYSTKSASKPSVAPYTLKPSSATSTSSSSTSASGPSSTTLTVPKDAPAPELPSRLNPPASTRPPSLSIPTRGPSQKAYKYYFSVGKAYLTFYKTGLKDLYANFKTWDALTSRISPLYPEEGLRAGKLTRAEWLTIKRFRSDIFRMPLFGLVFCICGEFTPLVVIVMSGVVPRSLWIPKQVDKARNKLEERRREALRNPDPAVEKVLKNQDADALNHKAVIVHIGKSLGLYSSMWDRIGVPPLPLIQRRLKERMHFVDLDDTMIERDGGVGQMEEEEARMAAESRGIDVMGRKEQDVKSNLAKWLEARKTLTQKGRPVTSLYLTRPSAWPIKI